MDTGTIKKQSIKFEKARKNLLIVVAFSVVNLFLAAFNANIYLLFSLTAPQFIFEVSRDLAGELQNNVFLITGLVIAFVVIIFYYICWLFAKRLRAFILVALILFSIDSLMFVILLATRYEISNLLDIAFHGWILFYLINGVIAWIKLRGINPNDINAALLENTLHVLPEESKFVDYEIFGNKIKFRYSFCFVNGTENPIEVSVNVKFKRSELRGWVKKSGSFSGLDDNGRPKYQRIAPGEKVDVVFVFEGEYLGGTVNEKLPFPKETALLMQMDESKKDTLHWRPEESKFVDYEVLGNNIKFRYSICFVNGTENSIEVALGVKFKRSELRGWVKNSGLFLGLDDSGEYKYQRIAPGEKVDVVFVFEGKYLGGTVNEKLSFPEEIVLVNR